MLKAPSTIQAWRQGLCCKTSLHRLCVFPQQCWMRCNHGHPSVTLAGRKPPLKLSIFVEMDSRSQLPMKISTPHGAQRSFGRKSWEGQNCCIRFPDSPGGNFSSFGIKVNSKGAVEPWLGWMQEKPVAYMTEPKVSHIWCVYMHG